MVKRRTIGLAYLVDMPEIAKRAKVSKPAVRKWRSLHEDFPQPVWSGAIGDLFDWREVEEWINEPRYVQLPPRGTRARNQISA